ncbi:MAG: hypothetical protein JWP36_2508 [Paucimonas sp.]|nr:hypothetical protein [Paucimonas sp.]
MKTDQERLEQLEKTVAHALGQLLAANLALGCLLRTHPDRDAAASLINQEYEQAVTQVLNTNFPESFLDGMMTVRNRFLFKPEA